MPHAAKPDFSEAFAAGGGFWLRAAIAEHGSRRRPWPSAVTWRSAHARPDGRARVAGTDRPNGATAAIIPGWSRSPLNAVGGWKRGLPITDFARFINSEIALLCGRQGAATHGDLLVGPGGTHEEIARPLEGRVVGHALGAKRVALESLDPSSGDRTRGGA
jgi:hypothetical protein